MTEQAPRPQTAVLSTGLIRLMAVTQLGYAVGLLLVVPIGDIVRRRPLLTGMLAVDTLAVVVGVTSVVVQTTTNVSLLPSQHCVNL